MSYKKRTDSVDSFYMKCSSKTLFNRMECALRSNISSLSLDPQICEENKTRTHQDEIHGTSNNYDKIIISNFSDHELENKIELKEELIQFSEPKDISICANLNNSNNNTSGFEKDLFFITNSRDSKLTEDGSGSGSGSESNYDFQNIVNEDVWLDLDKLSVSNCCINKMNEDTQLEDENDYERTEENICKKNNDLDHYIDDGKKRHTKMNKKSKSSSEKTSSNCILKAKKKSCRYRMLNFKLQQSNVETKNISASCTLNNDFVKKAQNPTKSIIKQKEGTMKTTKSVQNSEPKEINLTKSKVSNDKIDKKGEFKLPLFTNTDTVYQNKFKRHIALDYDKRMREKRRLSQERKVSAKGMVKSLTTFSVSMSEPLENNVTFVEPVLIKERLDKLILMRHDYVQNNSDPLFHELQTETTTKAVATLDNPLEPDLVRESSSLKLIEIKETSSNSKEDADLDNVVNDSQQKIINEQKISTNSVPAVEDQEQTNSDNYQTLSVQNLDHKLEIIPSEDFGSGEFFTLVQNTDGSLSVRDENISPVDDRVQEFKSAYKQLHNTVSDPSDSLPLQPNIELPLLETLPSKNEKKTSENLAKINEANMLIISPLLNAENIITTSKDLNKLKNPVNQVANTTMIKAIEIPQSKYIKENTRKKESKNKRNNKFDITFQGHEATYQVTLQGSKVSCKINQSLKETTTSPTDKLVQNVQNVKKVTKATGKSIEDIASSSGIMLGSKPALINLSTQTTKNILTTCYEKVSPISERVDKRTALRNSIRRKIKQKKLNQETDHLQQNVLIGIFQKCTTNIKMIIPSHETVIDIFLFLVYFATFSLIFGALRLEPPICDFKQTL